MAQEVARMTNREFFRGVGLLLKSKLAARKVRRMMKRHIDLVAEIQSLQGQIDAMMAILDQLERELREIYPRSKL